MKPNTPEELAEAITALIRHGTKTKAAESLGMSRKGFHERIESAKRQGVIKDVEPTLYPGRKIIDVKNGYVIAGSDAHYWPGPSSTAHRACVYFCKKLKPVAFIMNGDATDMAKVSRHPPLGWTKLPDVREELEVTQERLHEIEMALPKGCTKLWACGNHDARLEVKIASLIPELAGVMGTSLKDHFPNWTPCWSVFINDHAGGLVIKHRFKGGIHANFNNALWAGRSLATGHLHSQKCTPFTDLNGTRYGVDLGTMADIYGPQFAYQEDSPRNHRSGFGVFLFKDGELLPPELVSVIRPGVVAFRGELIEV